MAIPKLTKEAIKSPYRVPPQSLEAEMALLGSVMLRTESIHEIIDFIKTETFYSDRNRLIWGTMMDLHQKGEPVDLLTMSSRLSEKAVLERAGGSTYLAELTNVVPSASNIVHYARIVEKKYMMRQLIEASEFITNVGFEESLELEEILDKAEKRLFQVTNYSGTHKFVGLNEVMGEAWETIDRLHKSKDELRGVPTGFKEIDNKLAGLQKSDLIILAARPSCGKTSLALDIARNAAIMHNVPVGIFSLEMSTQQLVQRMLAAESRVDAWKLRTGHQLNTETDFGHLRDGMDRLSKAPIFVDDQPGNNILKMRSVARRLKAERGLGLIIVDYLQLMVPTTSKNNDNVVQQVTEISRSLKNLARELDVPVLALSQLSRAVEQRGGRPRLSDLRDSGSIEQDADVVVFIHREDRINKQSDKPNVAEILIEKHRNGPTGMCELFFDASKSTFLSMEKSEYGGISADINSF